MKAIFKGMLVVAMLMAETQATAASGNGLKPGTVIKPGPVKSSVKPAVAPKDENAEEELEVDETAPAKPVDNNPDAEEAES